MKHSLLIIAAMLVTNLQAQWSSDPNINNAICTAGGDQFFPELTSDGSGGAIITWADYRIQSSDIYAQRINSSGIVEWSADGVAICTTTAGRSYPQLTSDGSGGAIITWEDHRSGFNNPDIYAQRINLDGTVEWLANGVAICTALEIQFSPKITSDGSGGVIISWEDVRNLNDDIYAQRINSNGTVQWSTDGVAICTAPTPQAFHQITSDGSGGAIITWSDGRFGFADIYAQSINSDGTVEWSVDGIAICSAIGVQGSPHLTTDGSGGAIITWADRRIPNDHIYAQRINSGGTIEWTENGVAICRAPDSQSVPHVTSDGSGGAIITWSDNRIQGADIYAQRINSGGIVEWTINGVAICTATSPQDLHQLTSDGRGGAIVTWQDGRNSDWDIYASRVDTNGNLGNTTPVEDEVETVKPEKFDLLQNYPNPFNPNTEINYQLPERSFVAIKVFDVLGTEIAVLVNEEKPAGSYEVEYNASNLPSGVYFYQLSAGSFIETKKMILLR